MLDENENFAPPTENKESELNEQQKKILTNLAKTSSRKAVR